MVKKALIIHDNTEQNFDSMIINLKKAGLEPIFTEALPEQIGVRQLDTDVFVLLAGEYVQNSHDMLINLKNYCAEEEKPFCVVGSDRDVAMVEEAVPAQFIACKFVLPLDMKTFAETIKYLSVAEHSGNGKKNVLLVDDDVVYLKTVLRFLTTKYDVTAVRAGQHALKYIETHTPDLILLDYDMPVMSGPQTLEAIRTKPGADNIPVVFLTGVSDKDSIVTAMKMKPDGYLFKNTGKDELLDSVEGFFTAYKWKKVRQAFEKKM